MTYINRVGHVSVPEDLWAGILSALEEYLPETSGVDTDLLRRAREVDALHRKMKDAAARSTRDQIERGGSGQPYN